MPIAAKNPYPSVPPPPLHENGRSNSYVLPSPRPSSTDPRQLRNQKSSSAPALMTPLGNGNRPPLSRQSTSSDTTVAHGEWEDLYDDEDEGSVVFVRSNENRNNDGQSPRPSLVQVFNISGSRSAKNLGRMLGASFDNEIKGANKDPKTKEPTANVPYFSQSSIFGLTTTMRLCNEIYSLREIIDIYLAYDECSQHLFRLDRQDDFNNIISFHIVAIDATAALLSTWDSASLTEPVPTHPVYILTNMVSAIVDEWKRHIDYLREDSDKLLNQWNELTGRPWTTRRKDCRRAARWILRYVDGYQGLSLGAALKGIARWQLYLKREWRRQGRLTKDQVFGMGWAWVKPDEY